MEDTLGVCESHDVTRASSVRHDRRGSVLHVAAAEVPQERVARAQRQEPELKALGVTVAIEAALESVQDLERGTVTADRDELALATLELLAGQPHRIARAAGL